MVPVGCALFPQIKYVYLILLDFMKFLLHLIRNTILVKYGDEIYKKSVRGERKCRTKYTRGQVGCDRNYFGSKYFFLFFSSSVKAGTLMRYEPRTYEELKRHMGMNVPVTQRVFFNKGL